MATHRDVRASRRASPTHAVQLIEDWNAALVLYDKGDVAGSLGALSQVEPQSSKILYNRAVLTLAHGDAKGAESVSVPCTDACLR